MTAELETEVDRLEEELKLALVEKDPADEKDVLVEVRQGVGGDEAALWAARPLPHAHPLRRAARLQHRDALDERERGGRLQGGRVRGQGRRRVLGLQVRGRHAPRAARPGDRVAGPHPHLDRDGRGHARGRGGRGRDRGEGPEDRRHALDRPRRPEREHDRLGRPDHAPADRDRRRDAGREVAAPEPPEGDAGAARAAVRGRARAAAGRARRRAALPDRGRGARGEDPHLQLPREPDHRSPDQADGAPARPGARGRARRVHGGAPGRGAPAGARAASA